MRKNLKKYVSEYIILLSESNTKVPYMERIVNEISKYDGKIHIKDKGKKIIFKYEFNYKINGELLCQVISDTQGYGTNVEAEGRKIWQISAVEADKGWGPLLYEICIEYISKKNGALMPDRDSVTIDAENVWKKYLERTDVNKIQMDFGELGNENDPNKNSRSRPKDSNFKIIKKSDDEYIFQHNGREKKIIQNTPDNKNDDINQFSTFYNLSKKNKHNIQKHWKSSPLSKAFYKSEYPIIESLLELEKIKSRN